MCFLSYKNVSTYFKTEEPPCQSYLDIVIVLEYKSYLCSSQSCVYNLLTLLRVLDVNLSHGYAFLHRHCIVVIGCWKQIAVVLSLYRVRAIFPA